MRRGQQHGCPHGADTGDIPQNVNFAVSAWSARAFLDAYNVPYESYEWLPDAYERDVKPHGPEARETVRQALAEGDFETLLLDTIGGQYRPPSDNHHRRPIRGQETGNATRRPRRIQEGRTRGRQDAARNADLAKLTPLLDR